ncbi:MAG: MFS transporter [Sedimentisphaerales bacterium]|nr:MFS transporter [Sedimentisphaerales bacterium]
MNETLVRKVLSFRWLLFTILAIAYSLVYFHRFSPSVVANDLMRDFQTTARTLGRLGSIYFYCYAAMQFPAGLLSDSIGPRRTIVYSLLIGAAGSFLFAVSPSIQIAKLSRVLVGLGVSMVFIPTLKMVSQWFRAREFALMSGVLQAAGGVGILVATWVLGLLATWFGWRLSFHIIGVCTAATVAAVWLAVRDRPADMGWPSIAQIDGCTEEANATQGKIGLWEGVRRVVGEGAFWPVAVWFFFDCGIFFAFGGLWAGPYLADTYGLSKPQAGAILSMNAWAMILGGPLLGMLSQKVLKSRKKTFILCTSLLVGLLLFLNVFPAGLPRAVLCVWFFLFSVSSSAIVVMAFTTTKELFPVEIAGTSVGTVNFFPFFGGAIFMPLLGKVLDAYPKTATGGYPVDAYHMVLVILLLASLISLACTFVMKETWRP